MASSNQEYLINFPTLQHDNLWYLKHLWVLMCMDHQHWNQFSVFSFWVSFLSVPGHAEPLFCRVMHPAFGKKWKAFIDYSLGTSRTLPHAELPGCDSFLHYWSFLLLQLYWDQGSYCGLTQNCTAVTSASLVQEGILHMDRLPNWIQFFRKEKWS